VVFSREPNFTIFFQIGGFFLAVYLIFATQSFNQNQILAGTTKLRNENETKRNELEAQVSLYHSPDINKSS
jgi:hypothetical protein